MPDLMYYVYMRTPNHLHRAHCTLHTAHSSDIIDISQVSAVCAFVLFHLSGKREASKPAGAGVNMEAPYWKVGPSPERSGKREASKPVGAGW